MKRFTGDTGARNSDPVTSHLAATLVDARQLERLYVQALAAHVNVPLTTTEIANYYGMDRDSFSPRSRPLIRKGWIAQHPNKKLVRNSAGKPRWMIAFYLIRRIDT